MLLLAPERVWLPPALTVYLLAAAISCLHCTALFALLAARPSPLFVCQVRVRLLSYLIRVPGPGRCVVSEGRRGCVFLHGAHRRVPIQLLLPRCAMRRTRCAGIIFRQRVRHNSARLFILLGCLTARLQCGQKGKLTKCSQPSQLLLPLVGWV